MIKRQGMAHWEGGLKEGLGTVSAPSGVLNQTPYSFPTRFENKNGTNPEELIAMAHAGCFSMAFSALLEKEGYMAKSIDTVATVTLEKTEQGFSLTQIHLEVKATIPNLSEQAFKTLANQAKLTCPVSRVLNATITLEAKLI